MSEIIVPEKINARKSVVVPGMVFGRLTVVEKVIKHKRIHWLCTCICGNTTVIAPQSLISGNTKSCGCLRKERAKETNTTHGMYGTPEHKTWLSMKNRCLNPNDTRFADYGGRGITICDKWENSFGTFYADMGPRPEGCSIDRIDVDGDYEPSNCRWATDTEQRRNKRNNHLITHKGETKTLAEWSEITNIKYATLKIRINKLKWPVERALTEPVRTRT